MAYFYMRTTLLVADIYQWAPVEIAKALDCYVVALILLVRCLPTSNSFLLPTRTFAQRCASPLKSKVEVDVPRSAVNKA